MPDKQQRAVDCVKFNIGDVVYRKIDPEVPGMVVAVVFLPHGTMYRVVWPDFREDGHFDIELTKEKLFSTSGDSGDVGQDAR